MRLLEYQAKELFKERGIPLPNSVLVRSEADLGDLIYPQVLKAQVLTGGRGKAGAIQVVDDFETATGTYQNLLNMKVKNESVHAVLAEEKQVVLKEYYLSLLIDKAAATPLFIASASGGMDIEEVSRENPEKIMKLAIDPLLGLQSFEIRKLAFFLGLPEREISPFMRALFEIYQAYDATLIEINPLARTESGLLALDGKLVLDDKARFRHEELFSQMELGQGQNKGENLDPSQLLAKALEITYVPLTGDLGLVSDGAGTGMLTLDLIEDAGGHAANFCELGGLANADRMQKSLEILALNDKVKTVMISLIGGLTRMDNMAEGIVAFVQEHPDRFKFAVRMCGTKADEGRVILGAYGIKSGEDLVMEVARAVQLAKEVAE
ncbi:MAG TPA: ATP-grasp domain-containing protein [Anaerolineaceae bacterium]|nr:ATP-grasp domain-containing protein [Anaerolineaceae bacterium]